VPKAPAFSCPPKGGLAGKEVEMVKVKPNFLEVSSSPTEGALLMVPDWTYWLSSSMPAWENNTATWENSKSGEKITLFPQLFGDLLVLGVDRKIDPQTARSILELLRTDIPRFRRLRDFVLREVPEGSSERTVRVRIMEFWVDLFKVFDFKDIDYHKVRLHDGGDAVCTCWEFEKLAGKKVWCRHIKALHQVLRELLSPNVEKFPYHLPLLEVNEVSQVAKLIEFIGGLYRVMLREEPLAEPYSHRREISKEPLLGVEFEIPSRGCREFSLLKRLIDLLKEKGVILSYERDASVEGGEIKLKPFPATLEECLEKGKFLKTLRELGNRCFEDDRLAGLHVHINMWPYNGFSRDWTMEKLYPIVRLFEERFNLALLFGRGFNRYARRRKRARGKAARYGWINYEPLPYTVEVRLGCAKKGDPVKILLIALLLQRAFWARLEGTFRVPSVNASREKILSAFSSLLSEEERKYIVPLLESALIDSPKKRD
jgi:hypothetical protein